MKYNVKIVGLGPGNKDGLTLGALQALRQASTVILRTERHGVAPFLRAEGINYTSMDDIYENGENFDDVYKAMVKRIADIAQYGQVAVGVPGHPLIGERLTFELLRQLDRKIYGIDIIPGISQADMLLAFIGQAGIEGLKILNAPEITEDLINVRLSTVIINIYDALVASDVKLLLLRFYPHDLKVFVSWQTQDKGLEYRAISLYQLDRQQRYDHTTCLYLPPVKFERLESFDMNHLKQIMEILRSPEGCPWDKEQTHDSLKRYLIEEAYEVIESIDSKDEDKLLEELGDVLLQVVFHSQIAKERGAFDIFDVITRICQKMIQRHTHIFGGAVAENAQQVVANWEDLKKHEKGFATHTQVLRDIPSILPALIRSYKVQEKAALVGFDWKSVEGAMQKLEEELAELKEVYRGGDEQKIREEIGDLLFAAVNVARFLKVDPELALKDTIEKFITRFEYIEKNAERPLQEMTLEEMDELWNKAKKLSLR
ncbi:tetrapyrrole methylase family protein/MazG family protein [Caldicoprobacter guelmensis]|uniref:nucleoside triphosphate pyrophosphohydrolase n=1 Tax=Caldicoprobacter guelmensis TaxID=1170224 RepID=UPI00195C631B|nr:nucleoside triphosphate pyrophosphohydrolase [Caldicoprobacter guelmensis]MBM7582460.1 tetrapyrrole methylase family protein/MazG family protein [Caldicoprobacter guelmensis]